VVGLTRRQLGLCGAAVGLLGVKAVAQPVTPSVQLPDGSRVPALGQGSWHLAQGRHPASEEEEALRTGISLGLALIDTAEIYGDGRAEQMIGHVIAGQRGKVFLVSKVSPDHATPCAAECLCIVSAVDGSGFGRIEPGVRNVELGPNLLAPAPDTVALCVHTAHAVPWQAISLPGRFGKERGISPKLRLFGAEIILTGSGELSGSILVLPTTAIGRPRPSHERPESARLAHSRASG